MVFGAPPRKAGCLWLSGDKFSPCRPLCVGAGRGSQIRGPILRFVHRVDQKLRKLQLPHFRGFRRKLSEGHGYGIQSRYAMRHLSPIFPVKDQLILAISSLGAILAMADAAATGRPTY
jgi:hypothetical protein